MPEMTMQERLDRAKSNYTMNLWFAGIFVVLGPIMSYGLMNFVLISNDQERLREKVLNEHISAKVERASKEAASNIISGGYSGQFNINVSGYISRESINREAEERFQHNKEATFKGSLLIGAFTMAMGLVAFGLSALKERSRIHDLEESIRQNGQGPSWPNPR